MESLQLKECVELLACIRNADILLKFLFGNGWSVPHIANTSHHGETSGVRVGC